MTIPTPKGDALQERACYMIGNPSAWASYDEGASKIIQELVDALALPAPAVDEEAVASPTMPFHALCRIYETALEDEGIELDPEDSALAAQLKDDVRLALLHAGGQAGGVVKLREPVLCDCGEMVTEPCNWPDDPCLLPAALSPPPPEGVDDNGSLPPTLRAVADAKALLEQELGLAAPGGDAEGWVLVPITPTREMWAAMANAVVGYKQRHHDKVCEDIWDVALVAAPSPNLPDPSAIEAVRDVLRPIVGIDLRSPQEVCDIMSSRIRAALKVLDREGGA